MFVKLEGIDGYVNADLVERIEEVDLGAASEGQKTVIVMSSGYELYSSEKESAVLSKITKGQYESIQKLVRALRAQS